MKYLICFFAIFPLCLSSTFGQRTTYQQDNSFYTKKLTRLPNYEIVRDNQGHEYKAYTFQKGYQKIVWLGNNLRTWLPGSSYWYYDKDIEDYVKYYGRLYHLGSC